MTDYQIGDTVFLKAAHVFDGLSGKMIDEPRKGPLTIDNIYQCGSNVRLSTYGSSWTKIDASIGSFDRG